MSLVNLDLVCIAVKIPFFTKTENGRLRITLPGVIACFVISVIITNITADFIGKQTRPHRFAKTYDCRGGANEGKVFYRNTCEYEINLRYCLYLEGDVTPDLCRTTLLAPQEGIETLISDRLSLKAENPGQEIVRTSVWSCKAPFEPGMVPTQHKPSIKEQGCLPLAKANPPDKPDAGAE